MFQRISVHADCEGTAKKAWWIAEAHISALMGALSKTMKCNGQENEGSDNTFNWVQPSMANHSNTLFLLKSHVDQVP